MLTKPCKVNIVQCVYHPAGMQGNQAGFSDYKYILWERLVVFNDS
jgi:hypothetical protein